MPRQYKYPAPTFAPTYWPPARPVPQDEYNQAFAANFPEVASILPIEHVYVAGGAAAWPLGERGAHAGDIDLFVVGIDPRDRAALWAKVAEVTDKLRAALYAARDAAVTAIAETLAPGLLSVIASSRRSDQRKNGPVPKVQVILRAYSSVSALLHAFDLGSACVAYDGRVAVTTTLGAYACIFRVNLVNPAYRSLTYEARLAKYFRRGYALGLPSLRRGLLRAGGTLALPHITLRVRVARDLFASGEVDEAGGHDAVGSDYGPPPVRVRYQTHPVHAAVNINIRQLTSGEKRYVLMSHTARPGAPGVRPWTLNGAPLGPLPLASYGATEPGLADVLPRPLFEAGLDHAVRGAVYRGRYVNVDCLRRVFGLSRDELRRFTEAAAAVSRSPAPRDFAPSLARHRAAAAAKYDAAPPRIAWWVVADPGRQYTAAVNPRMEDPTAWYGADAVCEWKAPSPDEYVEALLATLEARGDTSGPAAAVYDGVCPLCRDPLTRGIANSVILPCGHIFHWVNSPNGCRGLYAWIAEHPDCPICRDAFDPDTARAPARAPRQPVHIDWGGPAGAPQPGPETGV